MKTKSIKIKNKRKTQKISCSKTNNKFNIGTSGFMVSQEKWLQLKCLNCIEINSTFYKLPTEISINKWNNFSPDVGIIIKASRYITHMKRLKNVKEAWNLLWNKIKFLNKLECVLFQLPPSFVYNEDNLQRIIEMHKYIPNNLRIAFEFRNSSWLNNNTYKIFKNLKWCIVATYIQKNKDSTWMGTMPSKLNIPPKTANFMYVRIHGSRGYKGSLDYEELKNIKTKLIKSNNNFVMFNNTFFDSRKDYCTINNIKIKYAAVCNAAKFSSI